MALEIFRAISNLRMVLDSETDADSPDNETTYKAMREMIEILFQLMLDTGVSGTATSDPPDDTTGYFYDTNESWTDDLHNGRTLVICSGNAKGNFYTIDDTDDANARLVCTGDNLYSDGVRSGDDYKILYDIKTNTDGHNHDGINSPTATIQAPTAGTNHLILRIQEKEVQTGSGTSTGYLDAEFHNKHDEIAHLGCTVLIKGTITCSVTHKVNTGTGECRVLKNGVEQDSWASTSSYVTHTENVSVDIGDVIIFQQKAQYVGYWKELRIYSNVDTAAVA